MVQCQIQRGHAVTPIWYAMTILPWTLGLAILGWRMLPGSILPWIAVGLFAFVELVGEVFGTLGVLAPYITDSSVPRVVWERLAGMHPAFLSPFVGAAACVGYLAILPVFVRRAIDFGSIRSGSLPPSRTAPETAGDDRIIAKSLEHGHALRRAGRSRR